MLHHPALRELQPLPHPGHQARCLEGPEVGGQVPAGKKEQGQVLALRQIRPGLDDPLGQPAGLLRPGLARVLMGEQRQARGLAPLPARGRIGRRKDQPAAQLGVGHDRAARHPVHPGNEGRGRPEIRGETQRCQGQHPPAPAGQPLPGLQEKMQAGLAPAVDGLLGVPHHGEGAAVPGAPAREQAAQEFFLVVAGVLEFIHQDMPEAPVQAQQQIGGALGAEQPQGRLLHGDKIQDAPFPAQLVVNLPGGV